jgi:hypothetical protein
VERLRLFVAQLGFDVPQPVAAPVALVDHRSPVTGRPGSGGR